MLDRFERAVEAQLDAGGARRFAQRRRQRAEPRDLSQRRQPVVGGFDAGTAEATLLRHHDVFHGSGGDRRPHADAPQDQPAAVRQRDRAWVWRRLLLAPRVDHGHRVPAAPERERGGQSDRAGAGHQDGSGSHRRRG